MASSEPAPVLLTPIDNVVGRVYSVKYLFFPESHKADVSIVIDTLRQGLSKTLKAIPILAGTVHVIDQRGAQCVASPWRTIDDIFRVKDLRQEEGLDYRVLKDKQFPLGLLDLRTLASTGGRFDETIKLFLGSRTEGEKPVMFVQVNIIKGGIIMSLCFNHSFTDGNGIPVIVRVWAAYCRGDDASQLITPEVLDRGPLTQGRAGASQDEFLEFGKSLMKDKAPPRGFPASISTHVSAYLFSWLPRWPKSIRKPKSPIDSMSETALFFFSKNKLADLKSMASAKLSGESDDQWISTNDALSALIGCCTASIRDKGTRTDADKSWLISTVVDGRRLLNPSLPADYIGNVLSFTRISAPNPSIDSTPAKVAEVAHLIRDQIKQRDEAYFRGIIGWLSSVQDLRRVHRAPTSPSEDRIVITSWGSQSFYDLDWGNVVESRIERVRARELPFKYFCCILPELKAPHFPENECGLEVMLCGLDKDETARLKQNELFMRFAQYRGD